jgi:hypothetical protein
MITEVAHGSNAGASRVGKKIDVTGLPELDACTVKAIKKAMAHLQQIVSSYQEMHQKGGSNDAAPLLALIIPLICSDALLQRLGFDSNVAITFASHQKWNDVPAFQKAMQELLLTDEGRRSVDPANVTRGAGERLPAFANKHAQAQAIHDDLREPTDSPTSEVTKKHELRLALERVTKLTPTQRLYIKTLPFFHTDDNKLIDHYTGLEEAKHKEDLEAETSSQSTGDVYTVAVTSPRGPPPAAQKCSHCHKPHATSECWSLLALQKGTRGNLGGQDGKGKGGGRNGN